MRGVDRQAWRTKSKAEVFTPSRPCARMADRMEEVLLIADKRAAIDRPREYRKSLISEAVTGKLKVLALPQAETQEFEPPHFPYSPGCDSRKNTI